MENLYLSAIVREIAPEIIGRHVARVAVADSTIVIDSKLSDGRVLVVSVSTNYPAIYLSSTRPNSREATAPTPFLLLLRKLVAGAKIVALSKDPADRIVRISLERYDAGGDRFETSLVVALTGRSANAVLANAEGSVVGALRDCSSVPSPPLEQVDLNQMLIGADESITKPEVLDSFFGPASPLGPLLKNEFAARSRSASPAKALRSLAFDLFEKQPIALVYSRFPLAEYETRLVSLKSDLMLSHVELVQAEGMIKHQFASLSEAAEVYYVTAAASRAFSNDLSKAKQRLSRELKKRESALRACEADLGRLGSPEQLKRRGELILANLSNATVTDGRARLIDYFDPGQSVVEMEIGEGRTLKQAAAESFAQYQKASRAMPAILSRRRELGDAVSSLRDLLGRLEQVPTLETLTKVNIELDRVLGGVRRRTTKGTKEKQKRRAASVGRRFRSTDGYEVVVGRNDRDNEAITFRLAKPQDIWLHAADYPGSHVVIRNPTRQPVPHRAVIEAAEIAAFYSQASEQGKAAVHYTQKKYVSKPPRSKPGLARLSSFKTVMVEPRCGLERIE